MKLFVRLNDTDWLRKLDCLISYNINCSTANLENFTILILAGREDDINRFLIENESFGTVISDRDVQNLLTKYNYDLGQLNVRDPELDAISKELSLDPYKIRRAGKSLNEQEIKLIKAIYDELGLKLDSDVEKELMKNSVENFNKVGRLISKKL